MGVATGFTAARMLEIENTTVVGGLVNSSGDLILETREGEQFNAGHVKGENATATVFAHVIGEMMFWTGTLINVPPGFLIADGTAVSRTAYAELFSKIGTTHGVGDGSTTFNLPNMLGRVPVSYDAGQTEFNLLGKTGGAKTHTLTTAEMPSHTHPVVGTSGAMANPQYVTTNAGDGSTSNRFILANGTGNLGAAAAGGGGAHNNLQPYLVGMWLIKALYTSPELNPSTSTHAHAATDVTSGVFAAARIPTLGSSVGAPSYVSPFGAVSAGTARQPAMVYKNAEGRNVLFGTFTNSATATGWGINSQTVVGSVPAGVIPPYDVAGIGTVNIPATGVDVCHYIVRGTASGSGFIGSAGNIIFQPIMTARSFSIAAGNLTFEFPHLEW